MKNVKLLLFVLCLLACGQPLRAQDLIYRMNPVETIEGKVTEVGETSIRYIRSDTREDVTFNLPTKYLQKIVFSDGKEIVYNDIADVSDDRRNAIKLSFLSPAYDATTLFYERGLKPGQSVEVGVGVIGFGIAEVHENADGVILKAGYKFISRPEFYQDRFRYAHLLKGSYIKPEVTYINYSYEGDTYYAACDYDGNPCDAPSFREKQKVSLFNVGIVAGKQWVFQNTLLFDLYGGLGVAFGSNPEDLGWHYNFVGGGDSFPITFTFGFKVGFLF